MIDTTRKELQAFAARRIGENIALLLRIKAEAAAPRNDLELAEFRDTGMVAYLLADTKAIAELGGLDPYAAESAARAVFPETFLTW
jgi:hypothetical protein